MRAIAHAVEIRKGGRVLGGIHVSDFHPRGRAEVVAAVVGIAVGI